MKLLSPIIDGLFLLLIAVFYVWENKMKFLLFLAICAALFWHTEIGEFINGSSKPVVAEAAPPKGVVVGAPHSNSPAVAPLPRIPEHASEPSKPVVVGKEEDNAIAKWFIDHTPKK